MNSRTTYQLSLKQKIAVLHLWNEYYPSCLCHQDMDSFNHYLAQLKNQRHILLHSNEGEIIAWFFDFIRDEEKWFSIIVAESEQGKGIGKKILNTAKINSTALNGWVIDSNAYLKQNGKTYPSPLDFYLKNGFKLLSDIRFETAEISAVKIQWKLDYFKSI